MIYIRWLCFDICTGICLERIKRTLSFISVSLVRQYKNTSFVTTLFTGLVRGTGPVITPVFFITQRNTLFRRIKHINSYCLWGNGELADLRQGLL